MILNEIVSEMWKSGSTDCSLLESYFSRIPEGVSTIRLLNDAINTLDVPKTQSWQERLTFFSIAIKTRLNDKGLMRIVYEST